MSNTRFILTNLVETGTLKDGTGGGAPALNEVSPYVTTNAQNSDRRSLWKTVAASGNAIFDIDLGSALAVSYGGAHGLTMLPADGGAVDIYYANSYYPGAWTLAGQATFASGERDAGKVFAAQTYRYWRVVITPTTSQQLTVGRIVLGNAATYDLGGIHSPGGISSPFQNRIEQAMQDGSFNVNSLGFPGRDFTFPFNQVTSTVRDQLLAVAAATGSVILVDADDKAYEVLITGGRAQVARNSSSLFNVVLEAKRLP